MEESVEVGSADEGKREATRLISWYSGVSRISCPSSEFVIFVFFDEIRKAGAEAGGAEAGLGGGEGGLRLGFGVAVGGGEESRNGARQRVLFIRLDSFLLPLHQLRKKSAHNLCLYIGKVKTISDR